jgi:AraC-like DNA-binding protein
MPAVDSLSLILDDIRLTGAEYVYFATPKPWAFQLDTGGLAAFHMVLQGAVVFTFAGGESVRLDAGDMVMIPGATHSLRPVEATDTPVTDLAPLISGHRPEPLILGEGVSDLFMLSGRCCFDVGMSRPLVSALPSHVVIRGIDRNPPEWLRIGLEFLAQEVVKMRPGRHAIINRLVDVLFIESVRDYVESLPEGAESWLMALRDPALSAALAAIHSRPAHSWSVPELAAVACLSRSAFAERFGEVLGQPPLTYLQAHRMRLAAWQLSHTRQPICRIAEAVGYASETAFSQAFKRQYGETPSKFRVQGG